MQPGHPGLHEALEEQRRRDRPGKAVAGNVVEVGNLGLEPAVIGLVQRQAPQGVALPFAVAQDGCRKLLVIGKEGGKIRSEGDTGGPGEGGHVDQQVRLLAAGFRQGIAEDQAALRIGVPYLHGQALAGLEHIEGPEGLAGDGIFHGGDEDAQAQRQARRHHHLRQSQGMGGSAHVLLHDEHCTRRRGRGRRCRNRPPSRPGVTRGPAVPQRRSMTGGPLRRRRAPHRMNGGPVLFQQRLAAQHAAGRVIALGQVAGGFRQFRRPQVVGRGVDEIADQEIGFNRPGNGIPIGPPWPAQAGQGFFLDFAIAGEAVAAERPTCCRTLDKRRWQAFLQLIVAGRQKCGAADGRPDPPELSNPSSQRPVPLGVGKQAPWPVFGGMRWPQATPLRWAGIALEGSIAFGIEGAAPGVTFRPQIRRDLPVPLRAHVASS